MNISLWFRSALRRSAGGFNVPQGNLKRSPNDGFSLLELLTALAVLGILAAIAAPGWVAFRNNLELSTSQDRAFQVMRQAQSQAKQRRVRWQASFREVNDRVETAIHPITVVPTQWEPLSDGIKIDGDRSTLFERDGVYRVQFDHNGRVNGRLGRLTLMRDDESRIRRCVVVSTLLGVIRKDVERNDTDRDCSPS